MWRRIITLLILIALAYIAPVWVTLTTCFATLFLFRKFYEIIIVTLIVDTIGGVFVFHSYGFSLTALVVIVCIEYFKTYLRD